MKRLLQTLVLVLAVHTAFAQWPCQAYFNSTPDTMNGNILLQDYSFNLDSTPINITSWSWIVIYGGASYTYNTQNPVVPVGPAYNGWIGICLTITTPVCSSTWCDSIQWGSAPPAGCEADFYYMSNTPIFDVDFYDLSTAGNLLSTINSWSWVITDDLSNVIFTSNLQNPSFTFPGNGIYDACLTITTDSGCTDTYCNSLYLFDSTAPNCQLYLNPVITHVSVIGGNDGAIDLSVSGGTSPYSYNWSNGAVTEDIYFLTSGIYTVDITQADTTCPAYSATFQIMEPYDTIPLDTLYTPAIDTCLNFVPDTFFVTLLSVDPSVITVVWTFQGQGVSQNVTVTYAYSNYGNYVIVLSIDCDSSRALTTYMTYIYVSSTFGLEEWNSEDLKIYPNPFESSFIIGLPENTENAEIFNHLGQLYFSGNVHDTELKVDGSSWPSGIYLLRLNDRQGREISRTLIKK